MLSWSWSLGRWFGVTVRVHLFFPLMVLGLILRAVTEKDAATGIWVDVATMMLLLFISVLLHEFGHCFGARLVDGDASDVLLWPLGGLASLEVPHTAWANFIATLAGPLVNLGLAMLACAGLLFVTDLKLAPPLHPFWAPVYIDSPGLVDLYTWSGELVKSIDVPHAAAVTLLARFLFSAGPRKA